MTSPPTPPAAFATLFPNFVNIASQALAKRGRARVSWLIVNADSRPPVAVRITRPYGSEDEYLEQELETLTRTSITLIGAQPRPEGVVLRFELVLPAGQVLLRGEGRVVGFKPNVHEGMGGLSLRFTRLDMRSKALIDRAAALREKRRPAMQGTLSEPPPALGRSVPPPSPSFSLPPPLPEPASSKALAIPAPPAEVVSSSALESSPSMPELEDPPSSPSLDSSGAAAPRLSISASAPGYSPAPAPQHESRPGPPASPSSSRPSATGASRGAPPPLPGDAAAPNASPRDREALLARLRDRAKRIDSVAILSAIPRRS